MKRCRICRRNTPSINSARYAAGAKLRGLCHHCIKREHWRTGCCDCFTSRREVK